MRTLIIWITTVSIALCCQQAIGQQRYISITIDDVPNTIEYQQNKFKPVLLDTLSELDIPFAAFINEDKLANTDQAAANKKLLEAWIAHPNAIIGNHSYSHSRYSEVGYAPFVADIEKGTQLSGELASKHNKTIKYFRFPFNDLGKDAAQHQQIKQYLANNNYVVTPFTVESSDWMFDVVYRHHLEAGDLATAKAIGQLYVAKTLELIDFFEQKSHAEYGRAIKQIYLCHDNAINADFLGQIIVRLQKRGYQINSLTESLTDPVYQRPDYYQKKWGVSWFYRWIKNNQERMSLMRQEPDLKEIHSMYEAIVSKGN